MVTAVVQVAVMVTAVVQAAVMVTAAAVHQQEQVLLRGRFRDFTAFQADMVTDGAHSMQVLILPAAVFTVHQ